MEVGPSQQVVQLTEVDVPGALLEETIDKYSIPWWLLCHGIEISSFVCTGQCITLPCVIGMLMQSL